MSISIPTVPLSTRKPGTYIAISTAAARLGLPVSADKLLLIGTQLATATATAEVLVQVFSAGQAQLLFGSGSPLALVVEALLDQSPYLSEVWCCPQDEDGAAAAASASLSTAISSLTAGTLTLYVGNRTVRVAITADDLVADIAAAISAALDADANMPFSTAVVSPACNLTAKAKGTGGNGWLLAWEFTGTGLTITPTQPTGGSGDADIQDALDVAFPADFDIYVVEYNDATSLDALDDQLDLLKGPMEMRPAVGVAGFAGTLSTGTTLSAARNSGMLAMPYFRGSRTHPSLLAAQVAAELGYEADRAKPLNGVVLDALPPDDPADRLSRTEQETALANGLMPIEVGPGGEAQIVRLISTYVADAFGSDDDTLLDLQTMRVLFYVQYACRYKMQVELAQAKLADSATTAGTTDPSMARTLLMGVLMQLQDELGYLERVEDHLDRLVVERDPSVATRLNATIPADIVDGLHVFAGEIQLILG